MISFWVFLVDLDGKLPFCNCVMATIAIQFSSIVRLCLTLCDPMDCSTPGLPVHHQLLELAQTHVH